MITPMKICFPPAQAPVEDDYPQPEVTGGKRNKVVNINATTQLQVVLVKPERFDDASTVADHLNAKRTVVLNLESTNKEVSRRLVDFVRRGVCQQRPDEAGGQQHLYYHPLQCGYHGDLLDELESNVSSS